MEYHFFCMQAYLRTGGVRGSIREVTHKLQFWAGQSFCLQAVPSRSGWTGRGAFRYTERLKFAGETHQSDDEYNSKIGWRRKGAVCALSDWLSARRRGADGALQLAFCPP